MEIYEQLIIMFSYRMRMAFEINTDNLTLPLHQRLSRCIYRIVVSQSSALINEEAPQLTTSHEDLAKMVGASRQSVSKELKQMERENLISIQYGKIVIKDLQQLLKEYQNSN